MRINKYTSFSILFLIYILLYSFNKNNGDYATYEIFFNTRDWNDWGGEVGYGLISDFFKWNNLSFFDFKFVLSVVTVFIIFRSVIGLSKYPIACLILFLLIYFPLDYVLIRNFLSFSIILMAFKSLYNNGKFDGKLKFALIVMLATIFHQTSIIFMVFIFTNEKKINFVKMLFSFFLFLFFYIAIRIYLSKFDFFIDRVDIYEGNFNQKILIFVYYIFNFFIFYNLFKCASFANPEARNLKNFVLQINVILFFIMIINFEIPIFLRVLRYCGFLNIIFFSIFFKINRMTLNFKIIFLLILYISWVFMVFIYPVWNDTYAAFSNNLIIDWFL